MNKFISFMVSLCLIVPAICLFTACGNNSDNSKPSEPAVNANVAAIAGNYSGVAYDVDDESGATNKMVLNFTLQKSGDFATTISSINGITTYKTSLEGVLDVNANKEITSIKLTSDIEDIASIYRWNKKLPKETTGGYSDADQLLYAAELVKNGIIFKGDYMLMSIGGGSTMPPVYILYKDGATKLAEGAVAHAYTNRDAYKLREAEAAMENKKFPTYKTDYYFEKGEYDLSVSGNDTTGKTGFIKYISNGSAVAEVQVDGGVKLVSIEITDVVGFDLTTAGVKTATIKYSNNGQTSQRQVTYTVVEDETQLPWNAAFKMRLDNVSSTMGNIAYIEKGQDLYTLGWKLKYEELNGDSTETININTSNCTGSSKVIDIVGYNKDTIGCQNVTIKFRGSEINTVVFVYDDTVNQYSSMSAATGSKVVIEFNSERNDYDIDYSNAIVNLTKITDSSIETKVMSSQYAIGLKPLAEYRTGDRIKFAYTQTVCGETYTFYVSIPVEVK